MDPSDKEQRTRANATPAGLVGVLVIDKEEGLSSFGVVRRVRRLACGAKTGHAGTLDPLATGILVLAVGAATRSIEQLMATDKRYRTIIDLTAFTTTDDREGERREVNVQDPPDEATVRAALQRFQGVIAQRPPAFSAMKVQGERAYRLARAGAPPELPPRSVRVDRIELLAYQWPRVELDIACGKGTYIRSIARDLGLALGTGGHCATLRRTAVGPFDESMARRLDELPDPLTEADFVDLATAKSLLEGAAGRRTDIA